MRQWGAGAILLVILMTTIDLFVSRYQRENTYHQQSPSLPPPSRSLPIICCDNTDVHGQYVVRSGHKDQVLVCDPYWAGPCCNMSINRQWACHFPTEEMVTQFNVATNDHPDMACSIACDTRIANASLACHGRYAEFSDNAASSVIKMLMPNTGAMRQSHSNCVNGHDMTVTNPQEYWWSSSLCDATCVQQDFGEHHYFGECHCRSIPRIPVTPLRT